MRKHTFYRFLSIALLPVAIFFVLGAVIMLLPALGNPPMLLPVFVLACVAIYIFSSLRFLNNGILRAQPCKPGLKDWIKVNAIVTIIFSILGLLQAVLVSTNPSLMGEALDKSLQIQGNPQGISKETLMKMMKTMMYVFMVIFAMLFIHVMITFNLLKKYRYVFDSTSQS